MSRSRLILILLLIGMADRCAAGTQVQQKDPAALEIRYDAATPILGLSDLITVTLTIHGSTDLDVHAAPLDLPAPAPWVLVERSRPVRETIGPKRVRWRLVYRFAPREPGKAIPFAFPAVTFRDGDEHSVTWTPIAFNVETQIAAPDRAAMRDITSIESLPPIAPADELWWIWAALACAGLLLVVAIIVALLWYRKAVARSPVQLALYELQRLIAMNLPEKGRGERFITLLTTLLRRYLERQFAIPARRRTTPEFSAQVESCPQLAPEEKQFLQDFLQRCDAVKFARQPITVDECRKCAEAVRQFLAP